VDWSHATFHEGWPHFFNLGGHSAITLPHSLKPGYTRTYFKKGKWDTCSCDGLGLIVHEGFHVLQFQNIAGGWAGIGLLDASTILYLACYIDHGFSYDNHPAEKAAYKVAGHSNSLYDKCCTKIGTLPCDCGCNPASLDQAGLDDFKTNCSHVVQKSNGVGFWTQLAKCTPGDWIKDWAKAVYGWGCESDLVWALKAVFCTIGAIISGLLWAIWGIWYGVWFVLMIVAALVGAILDWAANIVGAVVSGVVGLVEGVWDVISSPFSSSEVKGWLWFTTLNAATKAWQVPDTPITKEDSGGKERSRTKESPSLAMYASTLYAAYKSRDNEDLWYTYFDTSSSTWLDEDIKVTKDGKTRTSASPSLAAYNNKLYMGYRAASGDDLWFNVFNENNSGTWRDEDTKITKDGNTRTSHSPSLASHGGLLYMVYKSASDYDLWFNVFNENNSGTWRDEDTKITKDGKIRTSDAPALCEYNGTLYLAYKAASNNDIWYTSFDDVTGAWKEGDEKITKDGRTRTSTGPNLAVYNNLLYMVYKASDGDNIWYNVFDDATGAWRDEDCKVTQDDSIRTGTRPAAGELGGLLFLVYRGSD
jgi:hypothetical protein